MSWPLHSLKPRQLDLQDNLVEEKQSSLGLILGGGRHLAFDGEMRQEGLDLGRAERRRMTLAVEQHVASNPVRVRLLGTDAVVLEPDLGANSGEKGGADDGSIGNP